MSTVKKTFLKVSEIYNNLSLVEEINEYDANEKYLAIKNEFIQIEIYEIPINLDEFKLTPKKYGNIHCIIRTKVPIIEFKLNPNYLYVLLVIAKTKGILLFNIPKNSQKEEIIDPEFTFNINNIQITSAVFNPFNSHIIACYCSDNTIQIWSVKEPSIQKLSTSVEPTHIRWRKCGNFLAFDDQCRTLKIYNIISKGYIFYLDFEEGIYDFNFFGKNKILILNIYKNIIYEYEYDIKQKGDFPKTNKNQFKKSLKVECKYFFPLYDYYILYFNKKINLYKDLDKLTYFHECSLSSPIIIKTSNNKIITKIINKSEKNIQLIIIYNKNEQEKKDDIKIKRVKKSSIIIDSFDNSPENLNENYFINCPKCFLNIIQCLKYVYNEDTSQSQKEKQYFLLPEVEEIMDNNRNTDLVSLRKNVKDELANLDKISKEKKEREKNAELHHEKKNREKEENIGLFKSIKEEYIFYLTLLIKDETNPQLLLRYLSFLKDHEKELEKLDIAHETFKNELEYYSVILEKNKLKILFGKSFKSEKEKTKELLMDYLNNIKNNTMESFINKINNDYNTRYFNQPISFENKDLIYFDINNNLYYDILNEEDKDEKNLEKKSFFINEVLNRKIIDKYEQIEILIPLIHLILRPPDKEQSLFFLNMIESKTLSDEELKQKEQIYNFNLNIDNKGKKTLAFGDVYYSNPNDLCLENIKDTNHQKCEKYNYNYLIANQPLKLDINKIKNHLKFTLSSRVFKEAYKYLTGNDNYEIMFSSDLISEYINKIMFLPVDFDNAVSFHESMGLTTIISTMKKEINTKFFKCDDEICFILENGVIVAIIYHEFGHLINTVISFSENLLKLTETPRKKYLNLKEGGYYMEIALFGRVIKKFSLGEALYVLNAKNYEKSLEDFRKGFMELSDLDLTMNGEFKNSNLEDKDKINKIKNSIFIKAKSDDNKNDYIKNIQINIPLRNDILRRNIKEEDVEPYF